MRTRVHRPAIPQNLRLLTGWPSDIVAAARETVIVIKRTEPAMMALPIVEPDWLLPGISRRLKTSCP